MRAGHPRQGYRLSIYPDRVADLERFEYEHDRSGGPVLCEVIHRRGNYLIVRTTDSDGQLRPDAVWCIHAHYRTGLDLYGVDDRSQIQLVDALYQLEALGFPPTAAGIRAAVEARRLYPENLGPNFGLGL